MTVRSDGAAIPAVSFFDPQIEMAHGAGGKATRRLVEGLLAPLLDNPALRPLADAAELEIGLQRLALTSDGFVVKPLRFPGGSIGELAVNGTVNDLAMAGARPLALLSTLILEAGLPSDALRREVEAMAQAAKAANVSIVGGDTKVVENGKVDGLFISTAGIGFIDERVRLGAEWVRPGDRIILSGPIGDHGITVLLARGELDFDADIHSDTRPLTSIVSAVIEAAAPGLRWMRDPTRGGVASALNELSTAARLGVVLSEEAVPVRPAVRGACEILGLDPLHIANEGQFLAVVAPDFVEQALEAIGSDEAAVIGEIREQPAGRVLAVSSYGGTRVVDMLVGDPLPRIC